MRQALFCIISASMNAAQCRMARAALSWSINDLATQAGVAPRTIMRLEAGEAVREEKALAMAKAFLGAGLMFVDMDGKRGVVINAATQP